MRAISLIDLAPASKEVVVVLPSGEPGSLTIHGLTAQQIAEVMHRLPEMRKMMVRPPAIEDIPELSEDASDEERSEHTARIADVMGSPEFKAMLEIMPAMIAASVGFPEGQREQAERGVSALPIDEQRKLYLEVMNLTSENPPEAGARADVPGRSGKARATKSRKQSRR